MNVRLEQSWLALLKNEFEADYFKSLVTFVREEYSSQIVAPKPNQIFRALDLCPVDNVKVVVIGQDPYHTLKGYRANGLAFSVNVQDQIPPSLRNIYTELENDLGQKLSNSGDLTSWAEQGVLLLNATLTVRAGQAGSHQNKGWELFTDAIISKLSEVKDHLVFILWGSYARRKSGLIDKNKHKIIESAHPSPLSAANGFFGSKPFSKTNKWLVENNLEPINWII